MRLANLAVFINDDPIGEVADRVGSDLEPSRCPCGDVSVVLIEHAHAVRCVDGTEERKSAVGGSLFLWVGADAASRWNVTPPSDPSPQKATNKHTAPATRPLHTHHSTYSCTGVGSG